MSRGLSDERRCRVGAQLIQPLGNPVGESWALRGQAQGEVWG